MIVSVRSSTRVWLLPDSEPLPDWVHVDALVPQELERLNRYRHPAAREHFRRGRLLVRSLIARHFNCDPFQVEITLSVDGKPIVDGVHFNVSHTSGLVAVALGTVPVGIDVETSDPKREIVGLVNRFFAEEERLQFTQLDREYHQPAFLRGWTCKEALLKGIGSGVRDLQNCAVCLDPTQEPRVLRSPEPGWNLATWNEGNIGVAVATRDAMGT